MKKKRQADDLARVLSGDGANFAQLVAIAGLRPAKDFKYMDLTGLDFSGQDLRAFRLYRSDVAGCNFQDALLSPRTLRGALNAPSLNDWSSQSFDLGSELADIAETVDRALAEMIRGNSQSGAGEAPERLLSAMAHGSLGGGRRLRPHLVCQAAAIFGLPPEAALRAGIAVEMVHCYSLIHDDLPAMDDDDLRRGRPTVHRAFDEATAILAGDALLTEAFGILADPSCHPSGEVRVELIKELAAASGAGGLVGGQMRDLQSEGRVLSLNEVGTMQSMKTGALLRASVRMGAILGKADPRALEALTAFAEAASRALQLADDILDMAASTSKSQVREGDGLSVGRELGLAQRTLSIAVEQSISSLAMFGPEADGLRATVRFFSDANTSMPVRPSR